MARAARWGLVLVLAAALGACGGDDGGAAGNGGTTGGGGGTTLQVTAVDNSFEPSSLQAPAGAEVTVELTNDGSNPHTFTIDDPAVDTGSVEGGGSATVSFTMPDQEVTFYCKIHGQAVMSGTISPAG